MIYSNIQGIQDIHERYMYIADVFKYALLCTEMCFCVCLNIYVNIYIPSTVIDIGDNMPRIFGAEDIKRKYTGGLSRACAQKLFKELKLSGTRGTAVDFKAHKECIRNAYRRIIELVAKEGLTPEAAYNRVVSELTGGR